MQKKCTKCMIEKNEDEFYKDKHIKSGLTSRCKLCMNQYEKNYCQKNKEAKTRYRKKYNQEHREEIVKYHQEHRGERVERDEGRKDEISASRKKYNQEHVEEQMRYRKKYNQEHKKEIAQYSRKYQKNRKSTDIQFYLRGKLRIRLCRALGNHWKAGSAVRDLGCTIPELIVHLESQFTKGMTWENRSEWHLDHIKPLALFDLTDRVQFLEACNWKNLQPLWAEDNIKKGDRY